MSKRSLKWLIIFTILLTAGALLTLAMHVGETPAAQTASYENPL